jgi:hypothetical protein
VQITACGHPRFQCWITEIETFTDDHFPFNNEFRTQQRISHEGLWRDEICPNLEIYSVKDLEDPDESFDEVFTRVVSEPSIEENMDCSDPTGKEQRDARSEPSR